MLFLTNSTFGCILNQMTAIIENERGIHNFSINFVILKLESKAREICAASYSVNTTKFFDLFTVYPHVNRVEFGNWLRKMFLVQNNCLHRAQSGMRKVVMIFSLLVVTVSTVFSASPEKRIEILLQDSASGSAAVTQIGFVAGTSPLFIAQEDIAFVLQSPDTTPQLYSFTQDNVACSSNAYGPFDNSTILRLGLAISDSGTFIFSRQLYSNFDPASMLILEDRQLNVFTDLRRSTYKVAINQTGEINSRFYLHITYPPALVTSPAGCLNNDGIIFITEDSSITWTACKVFDSAAIMIAIDTNVTGNFTFTGLPGGNYTVEFDYSVYTPQQNVLVGQHQLVAGLNVSNNHDFVLQDIQFYTAASNATRFAWDFGDGSVITGIANPTYFYIFPGVYTARVNCSNDFGCTVESDTLMYIEIGTSVNSIDGNIVKIFTDKSSIRIEMDNISGADYNYSIYDLQGQALKTGPVPAGNLLVDMSNNAAGVYVVAIRSSSASLAQKVVIAR